MTSPREVATIMSLLHDLRYALVVLRGSPGFAAVAALTMALGIGANTAVWSVLNAVLLRPLPYESPGQLALLWTNFGPDLPQNWLSGPEFAEIEELNTQFEEIGVVMPITSNLTGDGEPEQINTGLVSGNFFHLLGVVPDRGRLVEPGDDRSQAERIAVLGHGFWLRRFGGDPDVLGSTLSADGLVYSLVGVLPPDFAVLHPDAQFPREIDLWIAMAPAFGAFLGVDDYSQLSRGNHGMRGFGRMKAGVTLAQAQADMDAVAIAMQEKSPDYYDFKGWGLKVLSLHGDLVEEVRPALLVLLGAVVFVLLIACVNVANLTLTHAAGREREIAVRTALGASRLRLVRQLLTESVTLALLGGALGLGVAQILIRILSVVVPGNLPRGSDIRVDGSVLLFTFVVALVTGIIFGLAPAFQVLKQDIAQSMKEGGRGSGAGVRGRRLRVALVVAEIALALVLLVGAGLMIRSFSRLVESDPGYRRDNLLTLEISLPPSKPDTEVVAFFDQLLTRVRGLPGVESVGAISHLPLSGSYSSGTTRVNESLTVPEDERAVEVDRRRVTPEYFRAMGVRLVRGRSFTEADEMESLPVAIVDEEFVRRFWPTEEPIGKSIAVNRTDEGEFLWRQVVGVVSHSKHYNLSTVGREQAYLPHKQMPTNGMYLTIFTSTEPLALASAVESEVWALDSDQPVSDVRTMASRVDSAVAQPRFVLLLLGAFAAVALLLAAVGIYGVISYSVSQRRHEIGVRMALGAKGPNVLSLVLRHVLGLVAVGLLIGALLSIGLTRLLSGLLYGVSPNDPLTYLVVVVLLSLVAAMACSLPALRATRVEPVKALRTE